MHRETMTLQTPLARPSQSSRIRPPRTAPISRRPAVIADELLKLHRDGAIKGAADASFFARLIRDFCATYTAPKRIAAPDPPGPYVPTAMQRVRVPSGLSLEERQSFLQKDLGDAIAYEPSAEEIAKLPQVTIDLTAPSAPLAHRTG